MVVHSKPALLGLPLELRQQIYHFVFRSREDDQDAKITIDKDGKVHSDEFSVYRSLALVDAQIHNESTDWFFSKSFFHFVDHERPCRFILTEFFDRVPVAHRNMITRINIPDFGAARLAFSNGFTPVNQYVFLAVLSGPNSTAPISHPGKQIVDQKPYVSFLFRKLGLLDANDNLSTCGLGKYMSLCFDNGFNKDISSLVSEDLSIGGEIIAKGFPSLRILELGLEKKLDRWGGIYLQPSLDKAFECLRMHPRLGCVTINIRWINPSHKSFKRKSMNSPTDGEKDEIQLIHRLQQELLAKEVTSVAYPIEE